MIQFDLRMKGVLGSVAHENQWLESIWNSFWGEWPYFQGRTVLFVSRSVPKMEVIWSNHSTWCKCLSGMGPSFQKFVKFKKYLPGIMKNHIIYTYTYIYIYTYTSFLLGINHTLLKHHGNLEGLLLSAWSLAWCHISWPPSRCQGLTIPEWEQHKPDGLFNGKS